MSAPRVLPFEPSHVEAFLSLPAKLYGGEPWFVPPLRDVIHREILGGDEFGRYGILHPFVCERDGEVLGRACAIVNPRFVDEAGKVIGQMGYYECIDDMTVAQALFDEAAAWLRGRGAERIVGPMNGGAHRTHRLMTQGFDRDAFLFEPRNPRYYPTQFAALGFVPTEHWHSYELPRQVFELARDRFAPLRDKAERASGYRVVVVDPAEPAPLLQRVYVLLDKVWAGHVGYASLSFEEFVEAFGGVLSLMTIDDIGFVIDENGADKGLAFSYPDYVEAVRAIAGDVSKWPEVRASGVPERIVLHTTAFLPEARAKGASASTIHERFLRALRSGAERIVIALVTEEWAKAFAKTLPPTREYVLYGRSLV